MATKSKVELAFVSEQAKKGTLKAFEQVRKLLSDKNVWIKDGFNEEKNQKTYCLLGATEHVNGPYEKLVKAIMVAELKPTQLEFSQEEGLIYDPDVVVDYNDAKKRKHSEILSFLDRCIKTVKALKIQKRENIIILGD